MSEKVVSIKSALPTYQTGMKDVSEALQKLIAIMEANGITQIVSCVGGWDVTLVKSPE